MQIFSTHRFSQWKLALPLWYNHLLLFHLTYVRTLSIVITLSWRSHFHSRKCTFLLQQFLSNPAGTLLWLWHWCLPGEVCSPSNSRNVLKLPKSETWKGMLFLQHMICRKTAEMGITPCLSGTGPALVLATFPHWSPAYITWFSLLLWEQMFPFRLPRNILFSLLQEKRENYVPYHYPLAAEGNGKYAYP